MLAEPSLSKHTVDYVPHIEINPLHKVSKTVRTIKGTFAAKTLLIDIRHTIREANRINNTDADDHLFVDIRPDLPLIDARLTFLLF